MTGSCGNLTIKMKNGVAGAAPFLWGCIYTKSCLSKTKIVDI